MSVWIRKSILISLILVSTQVLAKEESKSILKNRQMYLGVESLRNPMASGPAWVQNPNAFNVSVPQMDEDQFQKRASRAPASASNDDSAGSEFFHRR